MTRALLFGTGSALHDFLSIIPDQVIVVGLCDNDPQKQGSMILGHYVYNPTELFQLSFDFVVVTARNGEAIRHQLIGMGIEKDRILLFYPSFDSQLRMQINTDIDALNKHLGINLHRLSLCTMPLWRGIKLTEPQTTEDDFCRVMAFRLAAERIIEKKIPGAVAELGVYRGEMSALLNQLFSDRALYLFDTFEGFSQQDLSKEKEHQLSQAAVGDFQDTTAEFVISRMTHPEKVVIRKGYFPETIGDLDISFAFVSLDVDLYKPTLAGLQYFYPRLSAGGCIFVHDYNNLRYKGTRLAVEEFAEATGAPVVLLPDFSGTAILPK